MKSTYTIRSANLADVHFILHNSLSDTSAAELADAGHSWWTALAEAREWLRKGTADVFLEDGVPIAIFGHYADDTRTCRTTWFVCTTRWWSIGARGVRLGLKYLKSLQIRWPNTVFFSQPRAENDQTRRWFTILGFQPVYSGRQCVAFRLDPPETSDTAPVAC